MSPGGSCFVERIYKTTETIPPTQDSLMQHCKHVVYQAGIWTTSDMAQQQTPSPEGQGWTLDGDKMASSMDNTTQPVVSKACSELVKCSRKSDKGCGAIGVRVKKQAGNALELCGCKCIK